MGWAAGLHWAEWMRYQSLWALSRLLLLLLLLVCQTALLEGCWTQLAGSDSLQRLSAAPVNSMGAANEQSKKLRTFLYKTQDTYDIHTR
jgi:hypothetical protein